MVDWHDLDIKFWPASGIPEDLPVASAVTPPTPQYGIWGGDKYHGGFGPTQIYDLDYWTLRARSGQLFRDNIYAKGILRRLITNEINTGLTVEVQPEEAILGVEADSLSDWSEIVESRFSLYARDPNLCDITGTDTFGKKQRQARLEALIDGDVLVMLDISRVTGLPRIRLVSGSKVQTPIDDTGRGNGNIIEHGVELDSNKRHVAYWITESDGTSKRVPAYGRRSGRKLAWLLYGTERRIDDVRGEPLLSILLQSLKEVDRYRDAALRKATLNSILAMFIQKDLERPGTMAMTGGSTRKGQVSVSDDTNSSRRFNIAEYGVPGLIIEELQAGEKPVPHSNAGTDVNFPVFEEAVIQALAWVCEIPPEILRLAFTDNYSASQAAINEFKMYLNSFRTSFGEEFCQPIYIEWFIGEVLNRRIVADGFLEAWRNPRLYDIYNAWICTDWSGAIKPSTDILKQAKGYIAMVAEGWITNARAARELTGTKYSKNIAQLRRENEAKAYALEPLIELEQRELTPGGADSATALLGVVNDR